MHFVCYPKCSNCGKARDWLNANDGNHDWTLPQEIVDKTIEKYLQAYEMLTGKPLA